MMNTSGMQEMKSAPSYFKYMSDKENMAKEAAEAYYLNQTKSQSSYSSRSSSSVNATTAPAVNQYYNYSSQYSPNPYTNSYNPYNHHHHHYNHHYASQTLMPYYGERVGNSNNQSVGSPSTSLTIKKSSKSNNSAPKINSTNKTQSSKQETVNEKFTRVNYEHLKKILEKLNSIESKMSSFNESIKKTEDKLERVILNQQTFSTKLETIEKNSVSKLNLTPDLISGIKDALDIDFEIEFDVKPKIKSTKPTITAISANPKAITLD